MADKNVNLPVIRIVKLCILLFKKIFTRGRYYFKIWLIMSKNAFMVYINQKKILSIFLTGKMLRFCFSFAFLYFLVTGSRGLVGYTRDQVIFFFMTFNLVDIISQFLFREVYRFRPLVISGDLDLILARPIHPLWRVVMGGADFIDFITIPPIIIATIYFGARLHPGFGEVVFYSLMIVNSLIISLAIHIIIVSMGIITYEVDHTVMIFRDLSRLGSVPLEVFSEPFRGVITYIIPIGIMLNFPSKALMGLLHTNVLVISIVFGAFWLFVALKFWSFSLKRYTSASS